MWDHISTEVKEGKVLGGFKQIPFQGQAAVSPLNTVAKKDSNKRRIIVDLSFPPGRAVNDGIQSETSSCSRSVLDFQQ